MEIIEKMTKASKKLALFCLGLGSTVDTENLKEIVKRANNG